MSPRVLVVLSLLAVAACDKTDPPAPSAPLPAPAPSASAAPAASTLGASSAAPGAPSSAAASGSAAGAQPLRDAAADAAVACGTKPLPDCPLQGWMKANTSAAVQHKDFAALEVALRKTAAFAPPAGYPNWVSISNDGADAAKAKNLDAVKASCRGCHEQYKTRYKTELRTRSIAP